MPLLRPRESSSAAHCEPHSTEMNGIGRESECGRVVPPPTAHKRSCCRSPCTLLATSTPSAHPGCQRRCRSGRQAAQRSACCSSCSPAARLGSPQRSCVPAGALRGASWAAGAQPRAQTPAHSLSPCPPRRTLGDDTCENTESGRCVGRCRLAESTARRRRSPNRPQPPPPAHRCSPLPSSPPSQVVHRRRPRHGVSPGGLRLRDRLLLRRRAPRVRQLPARRQVLRAV